MKGIILAGGSGTRLFPLTEVTSKQLLPVYDKPMIYYPLSTLMLSGITEILVIASKRDIERFKELLGDGSHIGLDISYEIEYETKGIGNAFILGENFIGDDDVCLVLGDNIFYGSGFGGQLDKANESDRASIFCYQVTDPASYGVVEFASDGSINSLQEKPEIPPSDYVVTGLYFLDSTASEKALSINPSKRGELEITCLLNMYIDEKKLDKLFNRKTDDSLKNES